jgi:hypothetical protein
MNLLVCLVGTSGFTEVGNAVERVLVKEALKKRLRACGQFDCSEAGYCGSRKHG